MEVIGKIEYLKLELMELSYGRLYYFELDLVLLFVIDVKLRLMIMLKRNVEIYIRVYLICVYNFLNFLVKEIKIYIFMV